MHAVVIYESMFGNTELIGQAIAQGLRAYADVDVTEVGTAGHQADTADILVIGGPTHAFGMSRSNTRLEAQQKSAYPADVHTEVGIREWLACQGPADRGQVAAAYDTRIDKVRRLPGRASHGASRALRKLGYLVPVPAESFYVSGTDGPLLDGELARARAWGESIGLAIAGKKQGSQRVDAPGSGRH